MVTYESLRDLVEGTPINQDAGDSWKSSTAAESQPSKFRPCEIARASSKEMLPVLIQLQNLIGLRSWRA